MSLLEKASIITTPTAYGVGVLNSIKPAQSFGQELVTNGDFSNGYVGWNLSGNPSNYSVEVVNYDGKTNALHFTTPDNNTGINQIILQSNRQYLVKFDLKVISGNVYVGKSNNKVTGANLNPSEWTSYEEYWTANDDYFRVYSSGNAEFYVDNVSVVEVTDADFDFDRNSTGTRVNEDYLIEDVPYNLVSYSQDFNNSGWVKSNVTVTGGFLAPDGTNTAYKAQGTGHLYNVYNSSLRLTDSRSIWAKTLSGTGQVNLCSFNTNTNNLFTITDQWQRFELTGYISTGADNFYAVDFRGSSNLSEVILWGAQAVKGNQKDYLKTTDRLNIPRLDYTNGEPSILLEPSRTNRITHSSDFSNSFWTKNNATVSGGFTSPDGTTSAYKMVASATNGQVSFNVASGNTNTKSISVFAKANTSTSKLRIIEQNYYGTQTLFDLNLGVIEFSNSTGNSTMEEYPNGWYKCTHIQEYTSGQTSVVFAFRSPTVASFYLYGAQVEGEAMQHL